MTGYTDRPIAQLLGDVKREVTAVGKNETNDAQGFKFRGVDAVVNAAAPALDRHGVVILPQVLQIDTEHTTTGRNRTPTKSVTVTVSYTMVGPAGDQLTATVAGEAMDTGDKATAKAMSVAFRTCLLQVLNLPTEEKDPDQDTYERSTPEGEPAAQPTVTPQASTTPSSTADSGTDVWERHLQSLTGNVDELRRLYLHAQSQGCTPDFLHRVEQAGREASTATTAVAVGSGAR